MFVAPFGDILFFDTLLTNALLRSEIGFKDRLYVANGLANTTYLNTDSGQHKTFCSQCCV